MQEGGLRGKRGSGAREAVQQALQIFTLGLGARGVAGAAAQFVASMDGSELPPAVATEADILAQSVNALPEDTLRDALAAITRSREE